MITLKDYNAFDDATRRRIIKATLGEHWLSTCLLNPYHHNFDYDGNGAKLKEALSMCNKQKDGSINIVMNIVPKYAPKTPTTAKSKSTKAVAKKTPSNVSQEPQRHRFRRYTKEDPEDGEWVWAWGRNEQEARAEIEQDYWGTTRLDYYGIIK